MTVTKMIFITNITATNHHCSSQSRNRSRFPHPHHCDTSVGRWCLEREPNNAKQH